MRMKNFGVWMLCVAMAASHFVFAQDDRGKAEMKVGSGSIVIDYGRPALKGRDMLAKLSVGDTWRMGSNNATTINTPVELTFGTAKVPKGSYALVLKKEADDKFSVVFKPQAGQGEHGQTGPTEIAVVPMKKEPVSSSVEIFTIALTPSSAGGIFSLSWGTLRLSAEFKTGK